MDNCLFCQIAKKEINSYIITESDNFLAFLDIHPHAPGHTLIIPKLHFEKFQDLPTDLGNDFLYLVQKTISLIKKSLGTDNFTLGINEGSIAGQVVKHFHFHVMPRFSNDQGHSIHTVVNNPPQESLEEIYNKIRTVVD